jgi:hypothetical protein
MKRLILLRLFVSTLALSATSAMAQAPALSGPPIRAVPLTPTPRQYEPSSRITPADLGRLSLSADAAKFSVLKGTMRLRYVGHREADAANDTFGDVYEVVNGAAFAKLNKGLPEGCGDVRWLIIQPAGNGGMIWVWFLTIADWRDYKDTAPGLCRGDTFYPN